MQAVIHYNREIARLKQEQDKYYSLCAGLYEDLRTGVVTKEEFERLHSTFQSKAAALYGLIPRCFSWPVPRTAAMALPGG